jgi:hypothetical protein
MKNSQFFFIILVTLAFGYILGYDSPDWREYFGIMYKETSPFRFLAIVSLILMGVSLFSLFQRAKCSEENTDFWDAAMYISTGLALACLFLSIL